jgi:hypothetical protein
MLTFFTMLLVGSLGLLLLGLLTMLGFMAWDMATNGEPLLAFIVTTIMLAVVSLMMIGALSDKPLNHPTQIERLQ